MRINRIFNVVNEGTMEKINSKNIMVGFHRDMKKA